MLVEQEYHNLVNLTNMYARQYYFKGESEISDAEYDKLLSTIQLHENNLGYHSSISPTDSVGWYESLAIEGGKDFTHLYQKCYSLENIRTSEELKSFLSKDSKIVCMPKLDGCAAMLYYLEGKLTNVVTRGDGVTGQDITHLQPYIDNIPVSLSTNLTGRIEGEVMCPSFTKTMGKNQRNFVAGSLGLKNAEKAKDRGLSFISYNIVYEDKDASPEFFTDILKFLLSEKGIEAIEYTISIDSDPEILREIYGIKYKYSDGLVYKINNTSKWTDFTNHHPNFATAFKFKETEYVTRLIGVQWQTGKQGQVTPVGILEPIEIEGTTVQRASLANLANIKARGIKLFDKVNVIRAGAVIPQILSVAEKSPIREDIFCSVCPCCGSVLFDRNGVLFCKSTSCGDKNQKLLEGFIRGLGVKGLGPATISKLRTSGKVTTFVDFFNLTAQSLADNGDISLKVAEKIMVNLEDCKKRNRPVMWGSLGIDRFGQTAATSVFIRCTTLLEVTKADLLEVSGIGITLANNILMWIKEYRDQLTILEQIFSPRLIMPTKGDIVLTGTMDVKRTELKSNLESKGWKVMNNVSRNTSILLYGTNPGSKLDKARELGVRTVDYFEDKSICN